MRATAKILMAAVLVAFCLTAGDAYGDVRTPPELCPLNVRDVYDPPGLPAYVARSDRAELGRHACYFFVNISEGPVTLNTVSELNGVPDALDGANHAVFPEWTPVAQGVRKLVGTAVAGDEGPHISYEDWPLSHYTHDIAFHVVPSGLSKRLLGYQVANYWKDPCRTQRNLIIAEELSGDPLNQRALDYLAQRQCRLQHHFARPLHQQNTIEVEWEAGIGADNEANPCTAANDYFGNSCGYYSVGHLRRDPIWNWPTAGDEVTVFGKWIWDRGHPPAHTEIHPARLIGIDRRLPTIYYPDPDAPGVLATRIDIYGNGDGGALANNRVGAPTYVARTQMSSQDYVLEFPQRLPRPGFARLRSAVQIRPGDTFPVKPVIQRITFPSGKPGVRVTIPWASVSAPDIDKATFARTIYLWWDTRTGVPRGFRYRVFRVTLGDLTVLKKHDSLTDGEYRVLVGVGADYLFLNEVTSDDHDILSGGLGNTGENEVWGILDRRQPGAPHYQFTVIAPGAISNLVGFPIRASGWEADGVNDSFGAISDPNEPWDALAAILNGTIINPSTAINGCNDDPIGQIHLVDGLGSYVQGVDIHRTTWSHGKVVKDVPPCGKTYQDNSFKISYTLTLIAQH